MILREMPALGDKAFARRFYARWGKENCIIGARTSDAQYPLFRQRLSIKAAWGGREDYFVEGSRLPVDDDTFLILNEGRTYASSIRSSRPVTSFSIFFRPRMAEEVFGALGASHEDLLDDPDWQDESVEFSERLRSHDRWVSPLLRRIFKQVDAGVTDEAWYEEQLYFLLQRLRDLQVRDSATMTALAAVRRSTRRELFRRAGLASNFINARFASPITLAEIAGAALLSRFHCLRVFKEVHGMTPAAYLNRRRVSTAVRLLRTGSHSVSEVAALAGFKNRSTLFRQVKRIAGFAPSDAAGNDEHSS